MTTDRQIRANCANARRSTGPLTRVGRIISSRNSLRHGLEVPVTSDPILATEVLVIAQTIAGDKAAPELRNLAAGIAQAHVDLVRVRRVRKQKLEQLLETPSQESYLWSERIDPYEKRAIARRKFAIRAFDQAQQKKKANR